MADPANLSSWQWLLVTWQWLLVKDNSEVLRNYGFLAAAAIGFPFLISRTRAASRSAKAALRQAEASAEQSKTAAKQSEIAADQSIAEAFTRAISHLGDEKLEIRIGGIYALARIARDSKKDHWTIMEILTAFVRQNAPWKEGDKPEEKPSPPKPDIQTILTVLGRRERARQRDPLRLFKGAYLQGADLQGANLQGADLERADLKGAYLKRADLQRADLKRAHLQGADLKGADLEGADLEGADLHGADLQGVDFQGVDLSQVLGLTKEQIESAIRDDKTKLPDRLRPSPRR